MRNSGFKFNHFGKNIGLVSTASVGQMNGRLFFVVFSFGFPNIFLVCVCVCVYSFWFWVAFDDDADDVVDDDSGRGGGGGVGKSQVLEV